MKLKNMFILLFILGIADSFITYVFPVDFTFQSMSFVPHIAFMALLLVTYDRKWLDRVLIGGLYGLIYDFFFQSTFPLSFFLAFFLSVRFSAFGCVTLRPESAILFTILRKSCGRI